jgi:hypothetical protein
MRQEFFRYYYLLVPAALLVTLIWSVITLYVNRAGSGVQERPQAQHNDVTPARIVGLPMLILISMIALWLRRMTSDATSPPATKPAVQTSLWQGTDFAVTSNATAHDITASGNNGYHFIPHRHRSLRDKRRNDWGNYQTAFSRSAAMQ